MNKKKLLALLMALVMTFSLVPVTAFALEGEGQNPTVGPEPGPDIFSENVAQIGDTEYATLAEAIAAANGMEEATVTLLRDYDMEANEPGYGWTTLTDWARENFLVISGNVTFDLGGHTLSNLFNNTFKITGNVTVQNGKMQVGQYTEGTSCSYVMITGGGANLTVNNLTTYGGINVAGGSTATINDLAFSGTLFYAVCSQENSTVTINGGTFNKAIAGSTRKLFWIEEGSTMNITGGNFNIEGNSDNFLNGKFKPVITGGTFDFDPTNYGVASGYQAVDNNDDTWTVVPAANSVAQVVRNDIPVSAHTTLQEAINAAQAGDTVKLLQNVDATTGAMYSADKRYNLWIKESITLDGDGHTLTVKGRGIGVGGVSSKIDVTFKNVTINNTSDGARCIDTRGNIGTLTLDHVTLSTNGATSGYTQPLTIGGNQSTAATINITNSTIQTKDEATAYYAIITFNPVNMTIDNSTIKGWACIYAKGPDSSAGSDGSVFNITNSTLVSKNVYSGETNAFAMFVAEDNNVTFNVSKSELQVEATGDQPQAIASTENTNVNVNLGEGNTVTFNDEKDTKGGEATFALNDANLFISGGLFNKPVPETCCAEGYIPAASSDSTHQHTVKQGTYVAQIGTTKYETLKEAFDAAQNDDTITLLRDASENISYRGDKTFTLDLAGHTDTGWIDIHTGFFTLKDTGATKGKLKNSVYVYGSATNTENYSGFTLDESATIEVTKGSGIALMYNGTSAYGSTINVNGTVLGNVFVNGTIHQGNSVINVSGTITGKSDIGLALNGFATVNVLEGAKIQCSESENGTGIEVRAGTLNVNGGQIMGHGAPASATANGNGTTSKGAGIAIAQHTTKLPITVNISGGTISGYSAFYESNPQNNSADDIAKVSVSITGGSFATANGGNVAVYSADISNFISGGIFSSEPDADYIATGYQAIANPDTATNVEYPYTVGKVQVTEKADATVTVEQSSNLVESDEEHQTAIDAYKTAVNSAASVTTDNAVTVSGVALTNNLVGETNGVQAVVDAAKTKAEIDNNADFISNLNSAAKVEIDVDVKVTPKEYDTTNKKVLTFDLTPYATVTVTKENETPVSVDGVEVTNEMIDQDQPIFVKLYTGVEPKVLLHICDKTTESLTKGSEATLNTFKYADGYCEFYVSHFSDIKAILPDSSEGGFLEIDGGSLRRRVLTDNRDSVINYATDLRLRFKINLPDGAEIVQGADKSYFDWGLDESMSYRTTLNSTSKQYAALIINRVKKTQFDTEIYCQLHLTYSLGGQEYTMVCGPMHRSVTYIATVMADTENPTGDITQEWINYGRFLLGREGYETYNLSSASNN